MPVVNWIKTNATFLYILLFGLIIRFVFMYFQGLSHDELSAWNRTQISTWNEFWQIGVKQDMHPVFYQALLQVWIKVFGDSELAIRSTSILFYIANSYLIYRIAREFYQTSAGYLINLFYSCSTFLILGTVFARPYNSGVFFILLTFYSILAYNQKTRFSWKYVGLLAVGLVGAVLSHYFAGIVAFVLSVTGLIYCIIKQKKWFTAQSVGLMIAGLITCIAFILHWPVTAVHLSKGGLGWLGKPSIFWMVEMWNILFNQTKWLAMTIALIMLYGLVKNRKSAWSIEDKFALISFVLIFLITYSISILVTPILRDFALLFFLPFLLFPLFSRIYWKPKLISFVVLALVLHSFTVGKLLLPNQLGVFREVAIRANYWMKKIPKNQIEFATNTSNVNYFNYYLTDKITDSIQDWTQEDIVYKVADYIRNTEKKYLMYQWSTGMNFPIYEYIFQQKFPCVLERTSINGYSGILVAKKGNCKHKMKRNLLKKFKLNLSNSEEFPLEYKFKVNEFGSTPTDFNYGIKVEGKFNDLNQLYLVVALNRNGELVIENEMPLYYLSYDQSRVQLDSTTNHLFLAFPWDVHFEPEDELKCYVWNPQQHALKINSFELFSIKK